MLKEHLGLPLGQQLGKRHWAFFVLWYIEALPRLHMVSLANAQDGIHRPVIVIRRLLLEDGAHKADLSVAS